MILNCGHESVPQGISVGHGILQGYTLCLSCADQDHLASLAWMTRTVGYLLARHQVITTWAGEIIATVTKVSTARNGRQLHVWCRDRFGQRWYGQGPTESGDYVSLRKLKEGN